MRGVIAAVLILVSCGAATEKTGNPTRTCEKIKSLQIESDSVCLAAYECRQGDGPWFQLHMCFCWDSLCMCFIKKSEQPCGDPLDDSCDMIGGMAIIGPGACALSAADRNGMFFPKEGLQKEKGR